MVKIRYVSTAGNFMVARFDDDTQQTLYPTSGDMWLGAAAPVVVDPPVDPEPDPDPDPTPTGDWGHPLPGGSISSPYGPRNGSGGPPDPLFHAGCDFSSVGGTGPGSNVLAPCDLLITYAFEDGTGGLPDAGTYVKAHSRSGTEYSFSFFHMHPGTLNVAAGDIVPVGHILGVEGNSGNSFGSHLHFEIWNGHVPGDFFYWGDGTPVDPVPILQANGVTV